MEVTLTGGRVCAEVTLAGGRVYTERGDQRWL